MSEQGVIDALIVGAGPAGSAAAITLGRSGASALLVDKARFPRDKCCGDGLTTGALRRLERLGLDPGAVASFTALDELAVHSPTGRVARLPLGASRGHRAATARRVDLDAALARLAAQHVEVREGDGFARLDADGGVIQVSLESGATFAARHVIAADGAWSTVRRALGSEIEAMAPPSFYAYRGYARHVTATALQRLWVSFDEEFLPGYAWAFPVDGAVNLGVCFERAAGEAGARSAQRWRDLLGDSFMSSLLGPTAELEAPPRAWPIPAGLPPRPLTGAEGHVLFIGDAAHAADPFTGEGIAQALETGMLAADAVLAGGAAAEVADRYRSLVRGALGREQQIALGLRRLLASRLGARGAVAISGANALTRRTVGRWLYEDFPRAVAVTPKLWRRTTFTSEAPFARRPN